MSYNYIEISFSSDDLLFKSNGVYTKDGKDVCRLIKDSVSKACLSGFEEIDMSRLNYIDRTAMLNIYSEAVALSSNLIERLEKSRNE